MLNSVDQYHPCRFTGNISPLPNLAELEKLPNLELIATE
jgi:hypothetical protein